MRIELNEQAFWSILWITVAVCIITFTGIMSYYYTERTIAAFEGGYEETTLPGTNCIAWVKSE